MSEVLARAEGPRPALFLLARQCRVGGIRDHWVRDHWVRDYWVRDYWVQDYWVQEMARAETSGTRPVKMSAWKVMRTW